MSRIHIENLPVNEELQQDETRRIAGGADAVPMDQLSLNFAKIEYEYESQATPKLMQYCANGKHL